jgi:hypothetical protein
MNRIAMDLGAAVLLMVERVEREASDYTRRPELVGELFDLAICARQQGRPYLSAALSNCRRAVEREEYQVAGDQIRHAAALAGGRPSITPDAA